MNISLVGKRVLVTGAGRGIGRGIARQVAACGGHVIALARTQSELDSLRDELRSERGVDISTVTCDLTDWQGTRHKLENIGDVHCLVNNAGFGEVVSFMEAQPESVDIMFDINLKAVINVSQIVAKGMIDRGEGGAIVNISSQASMRPLRNHAVYCASKAALDQLSRVMTLELGEHNIRVNCVHPTVVLTELGKVYWSDAARASAMKAAIPLGRFAEVQHVADAVVYLLSDNAAMINGAFLPVDGGFTAC